MAVFPPADVLKTLGNDGIATNDSSAHGEEAEDAALLSDGRVLTAGARFTTPTDMDVVVAHYQGGPR